MTTGRSLKQWIAEEKGPYQDHMTSGELCIYLNINPRTLREWKKKPWFPPPEVITAKGWGLWSPDQQTALLRRRLGEDR